MAGILIVALGAVQTPAGEDRAEYRFTVEMSIKDVAPKLGVTGKALARELDIPIDVSKKKPLNHFGVSQERLDHATKHLLSHRPAFLKYYAFAALVLFGLVYLTRLGRPDRADISERNIWYPRLPYYVALVVSVAVCGFALGKSPNPMEGIVKVFKSMVGLYPSLSAKVLAFIFFMALALVGNKLICGWACPFGSLQELLYSLPVFRKSKQRKPAFWFTNIIRGGLLAVMLLYLFGVIGNKKGFVIHHSLNPFNLFDFDIEGSVILATIAVSLLLSFVTYRPFCYLICPFGFVSWLVERFSFARVRIDRQKCVYCGTCADACPSQAARGNLQGWFLGADCFSCGRCLNVCPFDAIHYGPIRLSGSSDRSGFNERDVPSLSASLGVGGPPKDPQLNEYNTLRSCSSDLKSIWMRRRDNQSAVAGDDIHLIADVAF